MNAWVVGGLIVFALIAQIRHVQIRAAGRERQRKTLLKEAVEKDKAIANFQGLLGGLAKLDEINQLEAEFAAKDRQLAEAQRRPHEAEAAAARAKAVTIETSHTAAFWMEKDRLIAEARERAAEAEATVARLVDERHGRPPPPPAHGYQHDISVVVGFHGHPAGPSEIQEAIDNLVRDGTYTPDEGAFLKAYEGPLPGDEDAALNTVLTIATDIVMRRTGVRQGV